MEMSKQTIEVLLHLLAQVNLNAMAPDADSDWARITKARDELRAALEALPVVELVPDSA